MVSKKERFWISFILRLAFGLFFLFAAINIFNAGGPSDFGPDWFATQVSKPFDATWLDQVLRQVFRGSLGDKSPAYFFLYAVPFAFAALSVPILTGILLRPALRVAAILLVLLGLGKYLVSSNDLSTTAYDFLFALMICIGLYFLGQEESQEATQEESAAAGEEAF